MISKRENYLRAMEFRGPEWIPCAVHFAPITWKTFEKELLEITKAHPVLFSYLEDTKINFHEYGPVYREGEHFRDSWGCLWYNVQEGLEGYVVENPLSDWSALATYQVPDPEIKAERGERDWGRDRNDIEKLKAKGALTLGSGERLFDRLYFLRGFENLMMDIAEDNRHLPELIEMVTEYELKLIDKWLEIGVDVISFHTDIGTQNSLMINPVKFRKYIKPMFTKLFGRCREGGSRVNVSSDGRILEIVDDLVECGVAMHDPQLRANTIDGIAQAYKGKLCINLDLDRQMFPFCSPADIRAQVKEAVEKLNSPEGGLMVFADIYGADVPMENIEAICQALEEFCLGE